MSGSGIAEHAVSQYVRPYKHVPTRRIGRSYYQRVPRYFKASSLKLPDIFVIFPHGSIC